MLTKSKFRPAWWLRNPHLQTLWAAKVQPAPACKFTDERLTTPDNDFVDLCSTATNNAPSVVIFHGLAGSVESPYVRALMSLLKSQGIGATLMHFRGCSAEPNLTAGAYHSGHTADIKLVIDTLHRRSPGQPLLAVGYSLGGNALLKYLATYRDTPLEFAIAVCPPLVLAEGAQRINTGFSKVYQRHLIQRMRHAIEVKHQRYPQLGLSQYPFNELKTFIEWDHHVTAPLHNFESGEDYYTKASTLDDLKHIDTGTHVIFSSDDPFFTRRCMPADNEALSDAVTFEVVEGAGHVGFISGGVPGFGRDWLRHRLATLVSDALSGKRKTKGS